MQDLLRHTTLQQLRIFAIAAEHQSFALSAEQLHLTQPAISMQMSRLSEQLDLDLFEKRGRKIQLTRAGERLYPHVKRMIQTLQEASDDMDALKGLKHGMIKAAMVTTARYFAPRLISRFMASYPEIEIDLRIANRQSVIEALENNDIDVAIMGRPPSRIAVTAEEIADHPYVIIGAPDHPLARKRKIQSQALKDELFIVREPGSGTRMLMDHFFTTNNFDSPKIQQMDSNESIKQAVMAGMGVALISKHTIALETQTGYLRILDVADTPIIKHWYCLHLENKSISPSLLAFKKFMLQEAPRHMQHILPKPVKS